MRQLTTTAIPLPDEMIDYLQALDYEVSGYRVLHTHALNAGVDKEKLDTIQEKFTEKFQEFQIAKQELYATYVKGKECKRWWVDYLEGVLYIAR